MTIRAKAPLRLSFAGGGTDVAPFKNAEGGCVLSTTIDKYAYGVLQPRTDREIRIRSLDYDVLVKYNVDKDWSLDGQLDLVKTVIKTMNVDEFGMDLFLHSDAPPGSGLGSSSTMVVALIGLFTHWLRKPLTCYEIARLAYQIERIDLALKGGMQDQYAAAFGGFNFIEFYRDRVIVNPLRVNPDVLDELQYNLLLCYTGKTRMSARIIETQIKNYEVRKADAIDAMRKQKEIAVEMKNSLLTANLGTFAELLDYAWRTKKRMADQITNSKIDEMYDVAKKSGAIGGKILGAGGGGYLLLFCEFDRKHIVAERLERMGGKVVNFAFDFEGLRTWKACV